MSAVLSYMILISIYKYWRHIIYSLGDFFCLLLFSIYKDQCSLWITGSKPRLNMLVLNKL